MKFLLKPAVVWCLLLVCAFVTACSGTSPVPPVPGAPQGAGAGVTPDRHKRLGKARLRIRIPHRKRHRKDGRYISPATKSITITINTTTIIIANLTPTSPGCSDVGAFTYCSLGVTAPFGNDTFQFVTYDGLSAGGHQLSANNVTFDVSRTSVTTLSVTLGGIAAGVSFTPTTTVPQVTASPGGFTIYGKLAQQFTVVPVDADGYSIIGPGAPAVTMSAPPSAQHLGVATPAPGSNVWSLVSSYTATNPLTPLAATVTAVVTPVPGSGGAPVSKAVGFQLFQPWVYVTDTEDGSLYVFDEQGNPITLPAGAWTGIPSPTGITYDPNNQQLYISGLGDNIVYRTDVLGVLFSPPPSPAPWQSVSSPYGILYVPTNNLIYVANTGYTTGVTAYTEAALKMALNPGIGTQYAQGLAFDPLNGFIYAALDAQGTFPVQAYDTTGNLKTLAGNFAPASQALGIGYDSHNGNLYVANQNGDFGNVLVFDETGKQVTTSGGFATFGYPTGVTYDPYNGLVYVADGGNASTVSAFDEQGNAQTGISFGTFETAYGVAVVP